MTGCLEYIFAVPVAPPPLGMVLIPGGTNAGTNLLAEGDSYSDSYPETYSLTVDPFYMDATEVTKAQWDKVYTWAITNGYSFDNVGLSKATNHPVYNVNWYDVVKWCNARSEQDGRPAVYRVNGWVYKEGRSTTVHQTATAGYRLPSGTEWEYAARGGLQGARFPWGNEISHSQANYSSKRGITYDISPTQWNHPKYSFGMRPLTSPVGAFAANGYGLYDVAGNLMEWCFDRYSNDVDSGHMVRGGCWSLSAAFCRVGFHPSLIPMDDNVTGFRAVLSLGGTEGAADGAVGTEKIENSHSPDAEDQKN